MGYTHYWNHSRDYTKAEWDVIREDITKLVGYVQHKCEIPLADGSGELGTKPVVDAKQIFLNGIGDNQYESFRIEKNRTASDWDGTKGRDFTKTARKPYDLVVCAILCYLDSIAGKFAVSSDGHGYNFVQGLEAARQALPHLSNQLDIPRGVMEDDRWIGPWIDVKAKGYTFSCCVDGRAYIIRHRDDRSYAFLSHEECARWVLSHTEDSSAATGQKLLFNAYGSFNQRRIANIAAEQKRLLNHMLDWVGVEHPERTRMKPPAFVRPGSLPLMAEDAPRHYDFASLLAEA